MIVSAHFHVASDIGVSCASESVSGLRHDQPNTTNRSQTAIV